MTQLFYRFFYHLAHIGLLESLNEAHLHALYYIFLPRINHAFQLFIQGTLQKSGLAALDFVEQVDDSYGIEEAFYIIKIESTNPNPWRIV